MPRQIRGIFGIWPFPILNTILSIFQSTGQGFANVEEWEVVEDRLGNLKKVIVHRKARRE